jgi:hypothetical protein
VRGWAVNLLFVAALAAVGLWLHQQTNQAERALCALRFDLEVRIDNSRRYLDDLDTGKREPIPGITRVDIVTGIQNQERTIDALGSLNCQ